jgi:threonylcarbamoyladenosine tRNA methylthiotransferase MtaB
MEADKNPIKTVSFKTLGCKLNQSETDALQAQFTQRGYQVLPFGSQADLTVINTCTVTNEADGKSRAAIRQAIRSSRQGRLVVTGCYAQVSPEALQAIEGVDLILGSDEKYRLFDHLEKIKDGKLEKPSVFVNDYGELSTVSESGFVAATDRTRAFLKIQDGCNFSCSYCIIPFARGRARSRSFQETIDEAKQLVDQGYRELVLTGVNLGTYKWLKEGRHQKFVDLVDVLQNISGLSRIRISSIEPNTVTEELLQLMSQSQVVCPHLHIPLQAGSDEVLKGMNRCYTTEEFSGLMELFQKHLPQAALGTDVIVGFPGESDDFFAEGVDFIQCQPFTYLHVFRYSPRQGTMATRLKDPVPVSVAKKRSHLLQEVSSKLKTNFAQTFLGREEPVLFEEKNDKGAYTGYTPHYLRVATISKTDLTNQIVPVQLNQFTKGCFQ